MYRAKYITGRSYQHKSPTVIENDSLVLSWGKIFSSVQQLIDFHHQQNKDNYTRAELSEVSEDHPHCLTDKCFLWSAAQKQDGGDCLSLKMIQMK